VVGLIKTLNEESWSKLAVEMFQFEPQSPYREKRKTKHTEDEDRDFLLGRNLVNKTSLLSPSRAFRTSKQKQGA